MKATVVLLLLLPGVSYAIEGSCIMPLQPGETHRLGAGAVAACNTNHALRHLCRRFCAHTGAASLFCRACRNANGPCGLPTPTLAECCAEGGTDLRPERPEPTCERLPGAGVWAMSEAPNLPRMHLATMPSKKRMAVGE
jgi:hypothetical protein